MKSNNEAKYAALIKGLEKGLDLGISKLLVYGDAMLIVKQIRGTWTYKNFELVAQMWRFKQLMGKFKAIELNHVLRTRNQEADALARKKLNEFMVGEISFQKLKFNYNQYLQAVIHFL